MTTLSARSPRGQSLVLFALTLLLLAGTVLITLSIGVRVKQKIETQTVADAAAYSNAVSTARTFNAVALLSRAQVAHMVAQSGAQALISFSSFYRGHLNNLATAYTGFLPPYTADCGAMFSLTKACSCQTAGDLGIQLAWIQQEETRVLLAWDALDDQAGAQARARWNAAMLLYGAEEGMFQLVLKNSKLEDQKLANDLANRANAGAPVAALSAPASGYAITDRELNGGLQCTDDGATCDFNFLNVHHVMAAMGTRGWPFVTGGWGSDPILTQKLREIVSPQQVFTTALSGQFANGSAYWSAGPLPIDHGYIPLGIHAMADHHGLTNIEYRKNAMGMAFDIQPGPIGIPLPRGNGPMVNPVCLSDPPPVALPAFSQLRGSNLLMGSPLHVWNPGLSFPSVDLDVSVHEITSVPFPGVWPLFIDYNYNHVDDGDDAWGQPKNMAVLQRDQNAMRDVFMLKFTDKFTPAGAQFDARGVRTAEGVDLSKQTAIATGMAYYHRHDAWEEVPNLLNPFWRATLVPADVDKQGKSASEGGEEDPATLLEAVGQPQGADVYRSLKAVGYKGVF